MGRNDEEVQKCSATIWRSEAAMQVVQDTALEQIKVETMDNNYNDAVFSGHQFRAK